MIKAFNVKIANDVNFMKDLKKNFTMLSFCIIKIVKCATNILKIGLQIKILCQKIILNRAFSIVKMSARAVTGMPP